ncbi:sphingosine kinase 2-like isoform X2 [Biomphalaria glabrata]|uniref:Sphingosine kinase 2-like isoform X2 n=1 Tax=Biomphalaria glabrata TaxID=6526 RepID=A0A9U8E320_BIOGL|nr:sphingosine kinase 2-like isoform X2 [Biomphalaria glabrata]
MTLAWSHDFLGFKMAALMDQVLLEGEFMLFPKKKGIYKLTLTRRGLYYSPVSNSNTVYEEKCILISDIVGCRCLEKGGNVTLQGAILPSSISSPSLPTSNSTDSNPKTKDAKVYLQKEPELLTFPSNYFLRAPDSDTYGFVVYAYPFKKKLFSSKTSRSRLVVAFEMAHSSVDLLEEKKKETLKWQKAISLLARDPHIAKEDTSSSVQTPQGKLLVLINPHSGPGKAYTIFKSEIVPMLYEANIPYTAVITDHAGHASELMKEICLSDWYGVVIVSGDGLIFETINGIMQRDDWASSINVPIGCLPGGSGNALCCSINYAAGEPLDPMVLHSTFILAKHHVVPMDLVIVQIPNRSIFSFLSVTWGIMADIDYESERYRNLGEARFTLGAIKRIVSLRTYRGRISFLPVAEYTPNEMMKPKKVLTKVRRFSLRSRSNSKNTLDNGDSESSPRLTTKRSFNTEISENGLADGNQPCGEVGLVGTRKTEDGSGDMTPNAQRVDSDNMIILSETQELRVEKETYSGKKSDFSPVPTPLLPPLNQDVPDNWVQLEGGFVLIAAVYQTHLGSDMLAAPEAHLCDGHINLMMVREGISRNALLNLFLSFGQGGHVHSPYVESVKVLAFRLEPETKTGNIMIDGERFEPCSLQAQILPGLARVMAIK